MNHQELDSLLAAYALGALEPEEARALEAHLQGGCADCERVLADHRRVAEGLLLGIEERSPRPELKAALLRRVAPQNASKRSPAWTRWLPPAAGLAACCLLLWVWTGGRQTPPTARATTPPPAAVASLPRITLKSGSVLQAGRTIVPGGELAWGSDLSASGGDAEIVVEKSAVLLLRAGTRLNLTREGSGILVALPQGTLFSAVVPGTAFGVGAGAARVDAHGTLFLVRHVEEGKTYVCICRGDIEVRAPGFQREMKSANDAQESGLNLAMAPGSTLAKAAKPAFYTDAEEDALQDAVRDLAGAPAKAGDEDEKDKDKKDED
jgi:ferric-dicitrate binding protein FerR (iron transport regulator)